ncbi:hypothetical protein HPB52_014162 [Rhipicephalus sanguineus]|uniref:DALR anticodon binding domain-containing protein n=1 Tax=Rhipicephalus sanguineus TaxID=34632 RepID=A0A9D4PXL0_RHISA|nr:hypothetical protein HPB52_014162 [Rhipicephalus sanguineus]
MAKIADGVDPVAALGAAQLLTRPASEFGNDPTVESLWAIKAVEHMEVYFNLISAVDPKILKLTPHDEDIYKAFRERFPNLDVKRLVESEIKSEESKKEWREFCMKFENVVEDFNFATLVRLDSERDYAEENTTLVPRVQFYAIEIARNREGFNDAVRKNYPPKPRPQKHRVHVTDIPTIEAVGYTSRRRRKHSADYRVFVGRPSHASLQPHLERLVHELLSATMLPGDQLNKLQPTVLYLIHEGTFELGDCSFDDYLEQRRTFVMGAFQRPQADPSASGGGCSFENESALTGNNLQAAINVLVETEVTYEFLSSKQNVKLKLCERLSHAEKGHYFSQYTLARIAAILDKYESSVKAGTYPALCLLEDVDFDLLCEEPEWLLWHRLLLCWQVLREPMPQTLPGSVKVEVNAHTLFRALEALCTEFSAYYSKVRVLVHPEPHLNATVFARIWLIKAVQRMVLCVLNRFGLKGLNRM